jgi:mannose-1-phosphate guanylyltransferase
MKAVVLVGGFGTRLRPLTNHVPKSMLPVGHRPIIAAVIDELARAGVTDVVLALGFKPEPFVEAFPDGEYEGVGLHYAVEPEPLDTAGAIRFAARSAGIDDTFLVVNGDILTDLDASSLVDQHRRTGAEATIHLTPVEDPSAFGVVGLNEGSQVECFVEKPAPGTAPSNLINAGTYVMEPSCLDRIDGTRKVSVEREVFPVMASEGVLYALPTEDYWIDTGRPALYLQANLDVLDGRRARARCEALGRGARVGDGGTVNHAIVGDGVLVGARAVIEDSVLLPGAVVEDWASIRGSIVAGTVRAAAVLDGCVIGSSGEVEPGMRATGLLVPEPVA